MMIRNEFNHTPTPAELAAELLSWPREMQAVFFAELKAKTVEDPETTDFIFKTINQYFNFSTIKGG